MAKENIVLLGVGDVGPVHGAMETYSTLVRPVLATGDIRFAQCERLYSESNAGACKPDMISIFADSRFDVVSLAGNHTMDWGEEAVLDTIALFKKKGMQAIGAGRDLHEARQPAIIEKEGVRVAFLAYCSVLKDGWAAGPHKVGVVPLRVRTSYEPYGELHIGMQPRVITTLHEGDLAGMVEDIARAKKAAHVVVVSIHWGIPYTSRAIVDYQPAAAQAAFEAGADLILGHHSHVPRAIEVHNGKVCFYSLSNFMFSTNTGLKPDYAEKMKRFGVTPDIDEYPHCPQGADSHRSLIAKATLSSKGISQVSFLPVQIDKQLRPEVLRHGDPRFDENVKFIDWVSEGYNHEFKIEGDEVVILESTHKGQRSGDPVPAGPGFSVPKPVEARPGRAKGKPVEISKTMAGLSTYISGAIRKPLPKEVRERAKLHLLDTLSAIISGSRLVPGKHAVGYVKTLGGTREACVIGTNIITTAVNAALANGTCAHADETDDSLQPLMFHPGASVVPAALALAERNRLSGMALLRAIALGYDVGARFMRSLSPMKFSQSGHHPPSFGGLFAAAAAAGTLANLNAERVRYMLSYTAQQAAGIRSLFRDPQHVEKAFAMGGMPAHNGVQAAQLAAHGFNGVADVFTGDRNFYSVFSPGADPTALTQELGKTYEIMNASIKKWPVGGPVLAPLDALETIRKGVAFGADDVAKVVVRIAEKQANTVNNRAMPDINLQHLIALMLLDGGLDFKAVHDFGRMRDPKVVKLKKRIELIGSANMDPKRRWNGEVEIVLRDGRTLKHYTHAARGSKDNPMTRDDENVKAVDLMAPVIGKRRAAMLIAAVWNIEKITDMRKMRKFYRA